jgi:hypothetical protein
MSMDRRKALATIAGSITAASVAGAIVVKEVTASQLKDTPLKRPEIVLNKKGKVHHEPLPYVALDPDAVADRAYKNKLIGDCMYGVFATIVEELADKVGGPYMTYPTTVTRYGKGGVMGWGTTCGTVNGMAMAAYLVSPDPAPIIDEVINYFQYAELPDYKPKDAIMDITPSIADSTLCHVSVSEWCKASGHKAFSKERTQRCAHLAASMTRKLVLALNEQQAGTFKAAYPIPAEVKACRACHDKGGKLENTRGKMSCTACHDKHEV